MGIAAALLEKIESNSELIDSWFKEKFSKNKPLFYNSVDLRHSGFKIAPIDTNCFPAGFNNLSLDSRKEASFLVSQFLQSNYPEAKKIIIIPENHTRNSRYLNNVFALKEIVSGSSNVEVILGSLIEDLEDTMELELENNDKLTLHRLIKKDNKITTKSGFEADLIISNNDFTEGVPDILQNIAQDVVPSPDIGWHSRSKTKHFDIYNKLAEELTTLIDIDPWLISSYHSKVEHINFKTKEGVETLANSVEELINKLKEKYQKYGIEADPYCYIKADNGTYGRAVTTAKSREGVININKKERNRMNMLKGHVQTEEVIIQEGVPTLDTVQNITTEPLIYLMNGKIAANLFRSNPNRDSNISLNSEGMTFGDMRDLEDKELTLGLKKEQMFRIYSLVSRLAALAAASE